MLREGCPLDLGNVLVIDFTRPALVRGNVGWSTRRIPVSTVYEHDGIDYDDANMAESSGHRQRGGLLPFIFGDVVHLHIGNGILLCPASDDVKIPITVQAYDRVVNSHRHIRATVPALPLWLVHGNIGDRSLSASAIDGVAAQQENLTPGTNCRGSDPASGPWHGVQLAPFPGAQVENKGAVGDRIPSLFRADAHEGIETFMLAGLYTRHSIVRAGERKWRDLCD